MSNTLEFLENNTLEFLENNDDARTLLLDR